MIRYSIQEKKKISSNNFTKADKKAQKEQKDTQE